MPVPVDDDSHPTLRLEEFLPYRLNILAETVSQSLSRLYAERYGLSVPEWRVMATLGQFRTMTASGVGRHSRMHKTKVSRAVAQLETRNLVRRAPDLDDSRAAFLSLTDEGRRMYEDFVPDALSFARRLDEALGPEERKSFDAALKRLIEHSEALANEMAANRRRD